mgnify:CR=1 FL=1
MNANSDYIAAFHIIRNGMVEAQYRAGYTTITVKSRFGKTYDLSQLLYKIASQKLNCRTSP